MSIIFITGNEGKFQEAKEIIPDLQIKDIDLAEIQGVDPKVIIEHKLKEGSKEVNGLIVVEDTSVYLDCLGGLPGPLIKWFMKTIGNQGLVELVELYGNSKATAKVILGLREDNGNVSFFEGAIEGQIVQARGENGFGWDPIFQPDGWNKTFAEMNTEEKNTISMRSVAFAELKEYLSD